MRDVMLRSFLGRTSDKTKTTKITAGPKHNKSSAFEDEYRQTLWGDDYAESADSATVKKCAQAAVLEVESLGEYAFTKEIDRVRVYRPIKDQSQRLSRMSAGSSNSALHNFQLATFIPGSVDTILKMMATFNARDLYWMNLHTLKGRSTVELCEAPEAFVSADEWMSIKYAYLQTSKSSHEALETCFAEYAFYSQTLEHGNNGSLPHVDCNAPSDLDQEPIPNDTNEQYEAKAYVYRRSVDERIENVDNVRSAVRQSDDRASSSMCYIKDFLYTIEGTADRNICKVALNGSIYMPKTRHSSAESKATDFIDYSAQHLASLRSVLIKQWKEQIRGAGFNTKFGIFRSTIRRLSSSPREYRACAICLSEFSFLRKRVECVTCHITVCSKCWVTKNSPDIMQSIIASSRRVDGAQSRIDGSDEFRDNSFELDFKASITEGTGSLRSGRSSVNATFAVCIACDKCGIPTEEECEPRLSSTLRNQFITNGRESLRQSKKMFLPNCQAPQRSETDPFPPTRTSRNISKGKRMRTQTADDVVGLKAHTAGISHAVFQTQWPSKGIILLPDEEVAMLKEERSSRARSDEWTTSRTKLENLEEDLANFTLKLL